MAFPRSLKDNAAVRGLTQIVARYPWWLTTQKALLSAGRSDDDEPHFLSTPLPSTLDAQAPPLLISTEGVFDRMFSRHLRLLITLLVVAGPAAAGMTANSVFVEVVEVGGQCDELPDAFVSAPNASGGVLRRQYGSIPYVVMGDAIPAQIGLGIGITVRIAGYGPGRTVTVRIEPPVGDVGFWHKQIDPDGTLYFGRVPATGAPMPPGRYLLQAYDGNRKLFEYALDVQTEDGVLLCVPNVS